MKNKTSSRIIIPSDSYPRPQEVEAARFFASFGEELEFISPSRTKNVKTPDVKMRGILWEIKSPTGSSKRTLANSIHKALSQSKNIIIDRRGMGLSSQELEAYLKKNHCSQ